MKKGFTLIELLIIIAIIGILAAIAIPKFVQVIDHAKIGAYYEQQIEKNSYKKEELLKQKDAAIAQYERDSRREGFKIDLADYTTRMKMDRYSASMPTEPAYGTYRLQSGWTVECNKVEVGTGGTNLSDCKDGKTYLSQINVVKEK